VSLGGQWRHDWLRVGVNFAHDDLDGGLPGSLSAAQFAANPRQTNTPQAHADVRNDRLSSFVQACVGNWELLLDAGQRHKELRLFNGYQYDYDVDGENYSVRVKHQAGDDTLRNALVLGADAGHWTREVLGAFGSLATQSSQALYVKDDITLSTGTRLSVGWRTEQLDKDNSYATQTLNTRHRAWELGLVHPITTGLSVYGRYGSSFRLPNVDEFGATLFGVTLMPQTSRDLEIGGRWTTGATRAELRLYRNALTNEIGYDPTVGAFGANINFDPTQRRGVELELAQQLSSTLQVRANGALRRATFRAGSYEGKDVPLTPRKSLALRADWKLLPDQQLSAALNMVSSQRPDYANSCSMSGYATVDARYAYQWGAAQWALGLNNLADRKYYTQAYRCAAGVTDAIYPEDGRSLTASVRMQF
jgi:iron complex outermembrane recepter protein